MKKRLLGTAGKLVIFADVKVLEMVIAMIRQTMKIATLTMVTVAITILLDGMSFVIHVNVKTQMLRHQSTPQQLHSQA